jgi:hypothetical protein
MQLSDFKPTIPGPMEQEWIKAIGEVYYRLADNIVRAIPSSAHRTAALRLLLESKMTLIHGITHPVLTASEIVSEYGHQTPTE